ncbi:MAG: carboxypeptidase-like regulatory domain-containing protein [Segetibacter sp.]
MKKVAVALMLLTIMQVSAIAQSTVRLSGKILDEKANPVSNASIRLLNTNTGTISNSQGYFSIPDVIAGNYTILISAIGYAEISKRIDVNGNTNETSFTLKEVSKQLDEVVVSAQKREEILQQLPLSITSLSARQVQEYRL